MWLFQREGIFVVCTNCGTSSARYDVCDSCLKPLPQSAKLYEPVPRSRSQSDDGGGSDSTTAAQIQKRNLSDSVAELSSDAFSNKNASASGLNGDSSKSNESGGKTSPLSKTGNSASLLGTGRS